MLDQNNYIEWLKKQGVSLFEGGGTYWSVYRKALIPASASPRYVDLTQSEARALLSRSGAWFIRYANAPCEEETAWWYIVCRAYSPADVSSKMRNMIKRGSRSCSTRQIDAQWLSQHGYECYSSSYRRYTHARPLKEADFRDGILRTEGGPFENWGVFVNDQLAGYCQCILENKGVATSVMKYHPDFLKYYSSYALIDAMLKHYVVEGGMIMSNGSRSIAHDTNIQDFLLKFGFTRQFCRLNIVYQSWLKVTIQMAYPLHGLIRMMPALDPIRNVQALLHQEGLRRACCVR